MHYLRDKPIIFFNATQSDMHKSRQGSLRGHKIKAKQQNKVYDLKTKRVDRINLWKLRYSDYDIEQGEQGPKTQRYDKSRATYQNFRQRSLSNRGSFEKRTIIQNNSNMMITSQSNKIQIPSANAEPIYFKSPNLESKMNDYLNLVIKKSQNDHNNKIQQMENTLEIRDRKSNLFLRKMKKSLKRKNSNDHKQQPDILVGARDTLRLLQNFQTKKNQNKRNNSINDMGLRLSGK